MMEWGLFAGSAGDLHQYSASCPWGQGLGERGEPYGQFQPQLGCPQDPLSVKIQRVKSEKAAHWLDTLLLKM